MTDTAKRLALAYGNSLRERIRAAKEFRSELQTSLRDFIKRATHAAKTSSRLDEQLNDLGVYIVDSTELPDLSDETIRPLDEYIDTLQEAIDVLPDVMQDAKDADESEDEGNDEDDDDEELNEEE